jgi:hypothetical protein
MERISQGLGSCSRIQYIKVFKRKKVICQENLLTPKKRALLEKLTSLQLVKNLPAVYGT